MYPQSRRQGERGSPRRRGRWPPFAARRCTRCRLQGSAHRGKPAADGIPREDSRHWAGPGRARSGKGFARQQTGEAPGCPSTGNRLLFLPVTGVFCVLGVRLPGIPLRQATRPRSSGFLKIRKTGAFFRAPFCGRALFFLHTRKMPCRPACRTGESPETVSFGSRPVRTGPCRRRGGGRPFILYLIVLHIIGKTPEFIVFQGVLSIFSGRLSTVPVFY